MIASPDRIVIERRADGGAIVYLRALGQTLETVHLTRKEAPAHLRNLATVFPDVDILETTAPREEHSK